MSISHWKHLYVIKVVQVANQFSLSVVTKTRNDSRRPTTIHNDPQRPHNDPQWGPISSHMKSFIGFPGHFRLPSCRDAPCSNYGRLQSDWLVDTLPKAKGYDIV